jgi:hypothetical protein
MEFLEMRWKNHPVLLTPHPLLPPGMSVGAHKLTSVEAFTGPLGYQKPNPMFQSEPEGKYADVGKAIE